MGRGPTKMMTQSGTLGNRIKILISRFPPVAAFGGHWLVSCFISTFPNPLKELYWEAFSWQTCLCFETIITNSRLWTNVQVSLASSAKRFLVMALCQHFFLHGLIVISQEQQHSPL